MAETLETPSAENMEIEAPQPESESESESDNGSDSKSPRDEENKENDENVDSETAKKLKSDKSVEEIRVENLEQNAEPVVVSLGPKSFGSAIEMFDYFFKFLRFWTPNININKFEHMVLLELLKKGHPEPDQKIGGGVRAFQVRYHPQYKSRCFFLIREDDSVDDFSFRKSVNQILPLPENMKAIPDVNNILSSGGKGGGGGRGGGRGRGRGRGHGRWGKSRN